MPGPYGFELNDCCQRCTLRRDQFFCQFECSEMTEAFNSIQRTSAYPRRALLFLEGQASRGVFVICQGELQISKTSIDGKTLILRVAKAGEVLGLSSVLLGQPYNVQAETMSPCQVAFVAREDFLHFLAVSPQAYLHVAKQLSRQYEEVCERMRDVALLDSTSGKIAKLLLDWTNSNEPTSTGVAVRLPLTHAQIAEFIGSSRETVTRTLGNLRDRNIVHLRGSILTIRSRRALEELANNRGVRMSVA